MEFTKEISFNEKLTADKVAKINYHGKLLDTNSDKISIIYGFGQNWDYTAEKAMEKTDGGYEVEVPMKEYDTFNFCFKDGNNNWDNNSQFNYISPIEKNENHSSGSGSGGGKKDELEELKQEEIKIDNDSQEDDDSVNVELADIEAELTRIFDELFSVNDETSIDTNVQLVKEKPKEESDEDEEGQLSDIEEIYNWLFKKAGYNMDYKSYKAEMAEMQQAYDQVTQAFDAMFEAAGLGYEYQMYKADAVIEEEINNQMSLAFDKMFEGAGLGEEYQAYKKSLIDNKDSQESNVSEPESKEEGENLDNLVEEILKPLSEQHSQSEETSNGQQFSAVDDFEDIDVKNIELEDINNYEIDDSTKDELQKLIEEIDSQIALFEERDEEESEDERTVEDSIASIEETIQIPELSSLRVAEDDPDEIDTKVSSADSDMNIDELFDYLKKYDEDDEEVVEVQDTVVDNSDAVIEQKLSLFDEVDDLNNIPEPKQEDNGADVKLATEQQEIEKNENEQSIFEKVKEQKQEKIEDNKEIAVSSRKLRNFYRITKKIKLAFIKIFYGIPKLLGKSSSSDSDE